MDKKEIIEGNKLIAEFMVWRKGDNYTSKFEFYDAWGESINQLTPVEMDFNSSWDWLMPVVEKIEDFHDNVEYQVVIYEDEVEIIQKCEPKWKEIVNISADGSGKLTNTWLAVVEFITWYNRQSK